MKVIDHINEAKGTLISFEILPPLKGKGIQSLYKHLDPLMEFKPSFINVTYHRSEHVFKKNADGSFQKVVIRKRPGTESICAAIMNKYSVDTVPHLICGGFSINETEDALINLHYLGIDNVLVLRGDAAKNESTFEAEPGGHKYASDLLKQVVDLNSGVYLEEDLKDTSRTKFCIGVAGYPEKHFEAPNMDSDLQYLKKKVDMGADYIVTQMFFDNEKYFAFVKAWKGDTMGNLIYKQTANNFNQSMAMAGKITVAEVEELVPIGELDPNQIHTPGIFVQRIFQGTNYEKRIERITVRE